MSVDLDRNRFGRTSYLVAVAIAVPLLGLTDALAPQPFAAIGFAVNLTVLGVAGGRALFGRAELSAVERAMLTVALPIGVLVLGTVAAGALRFHLDRRLWAGLIGLVAEAVIIGVMSRRGQPGEPRSPVRWRIAPPSGGGIRWWAPLAAAGVVLVAAVALSVLTAARQTYPAFSSLSAIRTGRGQRLVQIELTSEETAPTRFLVAISLGAAQPDSIPVRLAPGVTWRRSVSVARSTGVTVVVYRGTGLHAPYREVHLAADGGG